MDWEYGGGLLGVWAFFEGVYGIQRGPKSLMGVGGSGEKTQPARGGLWNGSGHQPSLINLNPYLSDRSTAKACSL